MNGAVVDHADDRDSEVTADPERDAEPEAAHDGDDVAAREPEARAVAQRRFLLFHLRGTPIFRQLDHLTRLLLLLHHPVKIDTALLTFFTQKTFYNCVCVWSVLGTLVYNKYILKSKGK